MSPAPVFGDDTRLAFPRGVRLHWDKVRGAWFLLAPERAMALDRVAAAILTEVDGETTLGEIVDRLCTEYDAPRDRIADDMRKLLASLSAQRVLEARDQ